MKYLHYFTNSIYKIVFVSLTLILPFTVFSQTAHYLGTEKNLNGDFLLKKAENTDFGNNVAAKIFSDSKNTYFAVDLNKLPTKYQKIRVLELSFDDKALVNILSDINGKYLLFLVNNTLKIPPSEIVSKLETFKTKVSDEEKNLNNEELKIWFKNHDKYSKRL